MARDIPSPCCGVFSVTIKEADELLQVEKESESNIWNDGQQSDSTINYTCHCGECGIQYGDCADSRSEAIYNYDQRCLELWRKNPNGLNGWMKSKPKDRADVLRRMLIYERMKKRFCMLY